jgi:RND family efflux transporter MFP subunit
LINFDTPTTPGEFNVRNLAIYSLLLITFVACSSEDADSNQPDRRQATVPTVEAVTSQYGSLPLEERLSGSVKAKNQSEIYPEIGAPVMEVLVNNGDKVIKGQHLIRLRDTEATEQLNQAEANLRIANAQVDQAQARLNQLENQLRRVTQLAERNLQSQSELEELQAEATSARASYNLSVAQEAQSQSVVEERRNTLGKMVIKAPISGVVGERNAEIGQFVSAGTRVFTIGDLSSMKVEVSLTEGMLSRINEGMRVQLTTPIQADTVMFANVTRISPFLNPVSHTAIAEIEITNEGGLLRPGMYVSADIFYGDSDQATLVPNNAIYRHPREGYEGIFVTPSFGLELNFAADNGDDGDGTVAVGGTGSSIAASDGTVAVGGTGSSAAASDGTVAGSGSSGTAGSDGTVAGSGSSGSSGVGSGSSGSSGVGSGQTPQIVGPTAVEFRRIEVVARGREVTAVRGIDPGTHIVTLGHNLLVDGGKTTRVKMVDWDHILDLQQMQSRDLIKIIQQKNNLKTGL